MATRCSRILRWLTLTFRGAKGLRTRVGQPGLLNASWSSPPAPSIVPHRFTGEVITRDMYAPWSPGNASHHDAHGKPLLCPLPHGVCDAQHGGRGAAGIQHAAQEEEMRGRTHMRQPGRRGPRAHAQAHVRVSQGSAACAARRRQPSLLGVAPVDVEGVACQLSKHQLSTGHLEKVLFSRTG